MGNIRLHSTKCTSSVSPYTTTASSNKRAIDDAPPQDLAAALTKVLAVIDEYKAKGIFSPRSVDRFSRFVETYAIEAAKSGRLTEREFVYVTTTLLTVAEKNVEFPFSPFHQAVREPFNFLEWGDRFWNTLVDLENSKIHGTVNLKLAQKYLGQGHNVFFLSNHQIEPEPQVMRGVFDHLDLPDLKEKLIMVAGHRVRSDPLSIPFSMGCNLVCVHSKKYIDSDLERQTEKRQQNLEAMRAIKRLMNQSGNVIWLAPSGGRDRPSDFRKKGSRFRVADFDAKTIQMFRLIAEKSDRPTHFFPMALSTAAICPPPPAVEDSVGEDRSCAYSPIGIAVGDELGITDANGFRMKHEEFAQIAQQNTEQLYSLIEIV